MRVALGLYSTWAQDGTLIDVSGLAQTHYCLNNLSFCSRWIMIKYSIIILPSRRSCKQFSRGHLVKHLFTSVNTWSPLYPRLLYKAYRKKANIWLLFNYPLDCAGFHLCGLPCCIICLQYYFLPKIFISHLLNFNICFRQLLLWLLNSRAYLLENLICSLPKWMVKT